jgi:predicted DNA-binding ribbon-helix-helix protein
MFGNDPRLDVGWPKTGARPFDVTTMNPKHPPLRSRIMKRSARVDGRKTTVSLEDEFWDALKKIAATRNVGIQKLISMINRQRQNNNLSSAIRVYVLSYYRKRSNAKA